MKAEFHDFIGIFDDAYPVEKCQEFIELTKTANFFSRNTKSTIDKQIWLDSVWPGKVNELYDLALIPTLEKYAEKYPYVTASDFVSSTALLQITEPPEGGYHLFHCEDMGWSCQNRILTWSVYLNDVEEGGETEFLYQGKKVEPKAGRIVIFPGSFTHLHRGNPTRSTKFIITGWWHGDFGLQKIIHKKVPDNL